MLTSEASRAARGLLGWSQSELARKAGVGFMTVSQFENGRAAYKSTLAKLAATFEAHGVELIADPEKTGAVLLYARQRSASP
jgi:transcriptional regulator with XRE-family HTH domain